MAAGRRIQDGPAAQSTRQESVAIRPTTKLVTKFDTSVWRDANQCALMPPPGSGTGTPKELNQLRSGLQGYEYHRPEHPFRESAADDKADSPAFTPQADSSKNQGYESRRGRQEQ